MAKLIALLLVCFSVVGQTLSVINTGTTSNDGTGDSLRTAFTKANTNFYQLWSEVFTNIPVDIANASAGKLNATNGTAVALSGSLTNVTVDGGRPTTDTRATAALFLGDSIVSGSSASATSDTWWYKLATRQGWTYTNLAFPGAVVTDLAYQLLPNYSHTNSFNSVLYLSPPTITTNLQILLESGVNDGIQFPNTSGDFAAYVTHYYQTLLGVAAYAATPDKTIASAMTTSGTWAAFTDGPTAGFGSLGRASTNSGSTLTFTTQGDAVYLGYLVGLTNSTTLGQFIVSIDGTAVETVDPNGVGFGNRNQWASPVSYVPYAATNAVWGKRYAGLGSRRHTVVITATNNTPTLPTVILWGAGSQQPVGPNSGPNVWLLEGFQIAPDSVTDATYSTLRGEVGEVVALLSGDGLPVSLIRPGNWYDATDGLSGDNIHPNNTGHTQIYYSAAEAIDRNAGKSLPASSGSGGILTAGNGLTASGGNVVLGGTLSGNTTITAGAYDTTFTGTLKLTPADGDFGAWVRSDSAFSGIMDSTNVPGLYLRRYNSSFASPAEMPNGAELGGLYWNANGAGVNSAKILGVAYGPQSSTNRGGYLDVYSTEIYETTNSLTARFGPGLETTLYGTLAAGATTINTTSTGLTITGDSQFGVLMTRESNTGPKEIGFRAAGAGGAALGSGKVVGAIDAYPYNGSSYPGARSGLRFETTELQTGSAQGTKAVIKATANGATTAADVATFASGATSLTGTLAVSDTATIATANTALTITGDGDIAELVTRDSNTGPRRSVYRRSRASSAAVQSGDSIYQLDWLPRNNTTYPGTKARIDAVATATHSGTEAGTKLVFSSVATGATALTESLSLAGTVATFSGTIELGNASDTTLARSAAGVVTIEGVKIATQPTTETLTASGGTLTITAGKGPNQSSRWVADGNVTLAFASLADNDGGRLRVWPATTNVTITLPNYASGPSGSTLTVNGGTGSTNYTEIVWVNGVESSTNRVSINALNYYR